MSSNIGISQEIIEAKEEELQNDSMVHDILELEEKIDAEEKKVVLLKAELSYLKNKRAESITIKWRESIMWCLSVDVKNPFYFIKSSVGVHKCIAYKHSIEITADIKNKIATTLSMMFKEQKHIGRIEHNGTFYYGLKELFEDDYVTLKKEYRKKMKELKEVSI